MARKARDGEVNKSHEVRVLLTQNPKMKAKEVVNALGERGIKVAPGLVYFIKGNMKGKRGRRRKMRQRAANVAVVTGGNDVLVTIRKVKTLASEVGGMKKLKALLEALSE